MASEVVSISCLVSCSVQAELSLVAQGDPRSTYFTHRINSNQRVHMVRVHTQTEEFSHKALARSMRTYPLNEYIDTHTHTKFCMHGCTPLAVATVAMLRVIPVFGGDLTLGRANWPQEALICLETAAGDHTHLLVVLCFNIYFSPW